MRLDKFISHHCKLSRKQTKQGIKEGLASINQITVTDPQTLVNEHDQVRFAGEPIQALGNLYFMLNKPMGYVCTHSDSHHPSALTLLDSLCDLHFAGRLDADTTGLVLITNDGNWSHRVTAPRHSKIKCYAVSLANPLPESTQAHFQAGLSLKSENKLTRPATLKWITPTQVHLTLQEGKYHQVKRMFAAVGNHVTALHRIQIGDIVLDPSLQPGAYRSLTEQEIRSIYSQ